MSTAGSLPRRRARMLAWLITVPPVVGFLLRRWTTLRASLMGNPSIVGPPPAGQVTRSPRSDPSVPGRRTPCSRRRTEESLRPRRRVLAAESFLPTAIQDTTATSSSPWLLSGSLFQRLTGKRLRSKRWMSAAGILLLAVGSSDSRGPSTACPAARTQLRAVSHT